MKHLHRILTVLLVAALVCLMGCSSAKSSNGMYMTEAITSEEAYLPEFETGESAEDFDFYLDSKAAAEIGFAEEVEGTLDPTAALAGNKLVYRSSLSLETMSFDDDATLIKERVASFGGYMESSEFSNGGSYRYNYFTVRIPSEQYTAFCESVETIGHLLYFDESVEDISASYYDTESRLESAKAELGTLQKLFEQAENMEDIITIEQAISDVQYEIDSLSGTLRRYDSLVNYSTISITLREVAKYSNVEEPAIGFFQRLGRAFKNGVQNAADGLENLVLSFANHFVGWLVFALMVWLCVVLIKRAVRKSKEKKQASRQGYAPAYAPVAQVPAPSSGAAVQNKAPQQQEADPKNGPEK